MALLHRSTMKYCAVVVCILQLGTVAAFASQRHPIRAQIASARRYRASTLEPSTQVEKPVSPAQSNPPSPAQIENEKFDCDDSVKFWQDFQRDGFSSTQENVRELAAVAGRFAAKGPDALDFWMRHAIRSGYFLTNAVLGTTGSTLHERFIANNDSTVDSSEPGFVEALANGPTVSRLVLEAALCYEQDYDRILAGHYKKPCDMYESMRQSSPLNVATQTARFVNEAIGTLARRKRQEKDIWISDSAAPELYPDYYKTAFHYQTDGWMSKASAQVYETSTETLFLGRQDAMQRTALGPIVAEQPNKVLEVACGTGRFMTFVRDNLPLTTEFTAIDLSPFYLEEARENDNEWRRVRSKETGSVIAPARLLQAQAENLPFEDNEFDTVFCVYLLHELPREIRVQVATEISRVVKPGGTVVFTDSVQRGDRPVFDAYLGNFERMNEPYYRDYIEDSLWKHFESAGLICEKKMVCSSTKTLTFSKSS